MRIALVNYNHSDRVIGGVETRYRMLAKALESGGHQCLFISTAQISHEEAVQIALTCDLSICDSAVSFQTPCPMITVFGNAWRGVLSVDDSEHIKQVVAREIAWHKRNDTLRVAVSNYMRNVEMLTSGIVAWHTIPNPADIDRFSASPPSPKTDPPTILWVGPIIPVKNPALMEAVRDSWKSRYPDKPVRWQLALRSPGDAVQYNDMTVAMKQATAVLCTSVAEGCSNTLMEAVAADIPIITTNTGLFWDWWDERLGVRVEQSPNSNINIDAFVDAIRLVLDQPHRFAPRQVAIDRGLDFKHWALRWLALIEDYAWRCIH